MKPLTTPRDPAYLLFVLQLSLATCIGETRYQRWKQANLDELREAFCSTDEPNSSVVENTFDVWARLQFMNRGVSV